MRYRSDVLVRILLKDGWAIAQSKQCIRIVIPTGALCIRRAISSSTCPCVTVALSFFRELCRGAGLVRFLKHTRFWREHNVLLSWSITRNLNNLTVLQNCVLHVESGCLFQAIVIAWKQPIPSLSDMLFSRG